MSNVADPFGMAGWKFRMERAYIPSRLKLAIAIEILIGVWIHALNVWSGILTPP
jgi:hypothetical protein